MQEVINPLLKLNVFYEDGAEGTDIAYWMNAGVPGGSLHTHDEKYFYFHHSNGKLYGYYRGVPGGRSSSGVLVKLLACRARGPGFVLTATIISCFQVAIWLQYY